MYLSESDITTAPPRQTDHNAPVNILLMDDEARNLDVLESILDSPDYRLVRARSADEALRALIGEDFAVLVLDIRMPGTTGLELAHLIKQRKKTQHIPIIFLTAYYQQDEHVLKGYDAGAVDYLSKPCNPSILRSKVEVFVDLFRKTRALESEIQRRRQVEEDLLHANELMEDRVRERTAELEQANRALRLSEERFRVSLQNAPITVYMNDRDLRYTWIHSTIPGWNAEHIRGRRDEDFLPAEFALEVIALKQEVLATGRGLRRELSVELDDEFRIFDLIIEPLCNGDHEVEGLTAAVMDVTASRQTAHELQQLTERLEQKVVERTTELRRKADQLRTMTIELTRAKDHERKRLAQVLHDGLQQLLVAARMRAVSAQSVTNRERRHQLLDQVVAILDDAVRTSRSLTAELSPPILYDAGLLPALEWLSRWTEEKHQMAVHILADPRAEPATEAKRVLLFDAAREFLFNTVKHAETQEARIRLERLEDGHLRLTVEDEGRGFDPQEMASVGKEPNGIGLLCLRERVELVGGQLQIDSEPGRGTRASLLVPAAPVANLSPVQETAAISANPPVGPLVVSDRRIRILLVDDHKIVRDGFRLVVGSAKGIEIVGEAGDGREALELASSLKPDVVIMDISMPDMNGVEATRRIVDLLPHVRVIGLSMHQGADMAESMLRAGAVAYLSKDGPTDKLLAAIRNCCTPCAEV